MPEIFFITVGKHSDALAELISSHLSSGKGQGQTSKRQRIRLHKHDDINLNMINLMRCLLCLITFLSRIECKLIK